ncbi:MULTISPECIES: hypothetical protein [unclassified Aureispira]|uniref:hypothetical protein n=1 Tax=unclassified Aureispira TaxID=2649989 RepID=UPI0006968601|nr:MULTISPECIES: hypothetical protein [unclassified Aureispira]WMX12050.1 hypothetical protein QP953_14580 [Aureispira sp. CCB-E]
MHKLFKLSILIIILFNFISCTQKEEEVHNHITIDVLSPTNNGTVSTPNTTAIKINLTADVELHDVEVTLKDSNNNSIAPFNPLDVHSHTKSTTIDEVVDLSSYAAGEKFTLTIEACEDHDCSEKETESISFSI